MPTKLLHIPTADGQADAFAAFPDTGGLHHVRHRRIQSCRTATPLGPPTVPAP